jgi:hypothetical protein
MTPCVFVKSQDDMSLHASHVELKSVHASRVELKSVHARHVELKSVHASRVEERACHCHYVTRLTPRPNPDIRLVSENREPTLGLAGETSHKSNTKGGNVFPWSGSHGLAQVAGCG